ncbi:MAG: carboxymuconolactone decarboxylase family protein [Roseococcus sp.]
MTRWSLLDPATTTGRTRTLLDAIATKRGRVPVMIRALGQSPAALAAYTAFGAAMSQAELPAALRERIAIAVAEANGCRTCRAAHTHFGRGEGVPEAELLAARHATSSDARTTAALAFAMTVMRGIGHVSDAELTAVREAGFSDGAIMEIVATVFINVFTNAVNHVAETDPDEWPGPEVP